MPLIPNNSFVVVLGLFLVLSLASCSDDETPSSGLASEGTETAPVNLTTASLPHLGQVGRDGTSYYNVAFLAGNTAYTITLTGLSSDADLHVSPNSMGGGGGCVSVSVSNSNESCSTMTTATGQFYIRVDMFGDVAGTRFSLNVF